MSFKVGDVVQEAPGHNVFPTYKRGKPATILHVDSLGRGFILTKEENDARELNGSIPDDGADFRWVIHPHSVVSATPAVRDKSKKWYSDEMIPVDLKGTSCCGVKEINGLQDEISNVYNVYSHTKTQKFGAVIITDRITTGKGLSTVKFIRKYKLGKVVSTPEFYNPNSGNKIQAWMWIVDHQKLDKFIITNVGF